MVNCEIKSEELLRWPRRKSSELSTTPCGTRFRSILTGTMRSLFKDVRRMSAGTEGQKLAGLTQSICARILCDYECHIVH